MNLLLRILFLLIFAGIGKLGAQSLSTESAHILAAGTRYLRSVYDQQSDSLEILFDGKRYIPSQLETNGHPYYPEDRLSPCVILLENRSLSGIQLRYDVYRNQLVYVPDDKWLGEIALNKDRVQGFEIENHRFVYLHSFPPQANGRPAALAPGYYEVLYEGEVIAYAKRVKSFTANPGGTFDQGKYWENDSRYLVVKDHIYPIRKKKDLVKVLNDPTNALRDYMRKTHFRFGTATDVELARLLAFYDTL